MKVTLSEVEHYLLLLAETPQHISTSLAALDEIRLYSAQVEGDWSLVQVLAHLRAAADVWGNSIDEMLQMENPLVEYLHPNQWMRTAGYARLEFQTSFQAYCHQRELLLEKLRILTPEDWLRPAVIRGRTHTVFSQTRRMALHEADHWDQIDRLCKAR